LVCPDAFLTTLTITTTSTTTITTTSTTTMTTNRKPQIFILAPSGLSYKLVLKVVDVVKTCG